MEDFVIDGLLFQLTCWGCPEQYDVRDSNGDMVGYLRLRHGYFCVDYPDVGHKTIFEAEPKGDGRFYNQEERDFYIKKAAEAINKEIKNSRKG